MKILLVNCSPVRNGATAQIIKIINSYLETKYEVESVCIDDYDIKFCKGCRTCHQTAKCDQDNDTVKLIEKYEKADIRHGVTHMSHIPRSEKEKKVMRLRCEQARV